MQIIQNKWFLPILAMFIALSISSLRIYTYLDGVLNNYAASFYVDNSDHFVFWTFHTREVQGLVDAIGARKKELDERESRLAEWQERLEAQKKELATVKGQLESFRNSLSNIIVQSSGDEMKNLKTISSTYAAMSPDAVVGILNQMEENTVVKILSLMKPDTVGPIFEAMARIPGQEEQMRSRIARLSDKMRLFKQTSAN